MELIKKKLNFSRIIKLNDLLIRMLPSFVGVLAFLIIYGIAPLNPQNDAWIMAGYDGNDIMQHYSGWLAFRDSAWRFPIGLAENMAVGEGTFISYTDSIPWIAIFFKIFRNFLPETFQYFGIYTLVCYVLQAVSAFKILLFKTEDSVFSILGTLLFAFSPILIERAFRHTALGSQWLILFSILLYFKHKKKAGKITYFFYTLFGCLAIGIHPYFLPMVFGFSLLCTFKDMSERKWWSAGVFLIELLMTYLTGCFIGVLGSGINVSRGGFGYYSMNLNAVMNPTSYGGYNWSSFLKVHSQILGNCDGFNYLGGGILLLAFIAAAFVVAFSSWREMLELIKNHTLLVIFMVLLTAFAVSNVVTVNDIVLFTCPLPKRILKLCGIFRASSRMFYPVYYMSIIFLLIVLWRYREKVRRSGCVLLLLLIIFVQFADIYHVVIEKHERMKENIEYASLLQDNKLLELSKNKDGVILDSFTGTTVKVATWAHKYGLKTYYTVANSGEYPKCNELRDKILESVDDSCDLGSTVVVTTEYADVLKYLQFPTTSVYRYDDMYFLYKADELAMDR